MIHLYFNGSVVSNRLSRHHSTLRGRPERCFLVQNSAETTDRARRSYKVGPRLTLARPRYLGCVLLVGAAIFGRLVANRTLTGTRGCYVVRNGIRHLDAAKTLNGVNPTK